MNKQINEFKKILYGNYYDKRDLIVKHLYLNIFVYDKDLCFRKEVVKQGYYHDILQYDKDWEVRWHVAYSTTDKSILEHLLNDINEHVRNNSKQRLNELGYE